MYDLTLGVVLMLCFSLKQNSVHFCGDMLFSL